MFPPFFGQVWSRPPTDGVPVLSMPHARRFMRFFLTGRKIPDIVEEKSLRSGIGRMCVPCGGRKEGQAMENITVETGSYYPGSRMNKGYPKIVKKGDGLYFDGYRWRTVLDVLFRKGKRQGIDTDYLVSYDEGKRTITITQIDA